MAVAGAFGDVVSTAAGGAFAFGAPYAGLVGNRRGTPSSTPKGFLNRDLPYFTHG